MRSCPVPKPYPAEFRARAVALVRAGKPISCVARELGVSEGGLYNWVRQDRLDRGELAGVSTAESSELRAAGAGAGSASWSCRSRL